MGRLRALTATARSLFGTSKDKAPRDSGELENVEKKRFVVDDVDVENGSATTRTFTAGMGGKVPQPISRPVRRPKPVVLDGSQIYAEESYTSTSNQEGETTPEVVVPTNQKTMQTFSLMDTVSAALRKRESESAPETVENTSRDMLKDELASEAHAKSVKAKIDELEKRNNPTGTSQSDPGFCTVQRKVVRKPRSSSQARKEANSLSVGNDEEVNSVRSQADTNKVTNRRRASIVNVESSHENGLPLPNVVPVLDVAPTGKDEMQSHFSQFSHENIHTIPARAEGHARLQQAVGTKTSALVRDVFKDLALNHQTQLHPSVPRSGVSTAQDLYHESSKMGNQSAIRVWNLDGATAASHEHQIEPGANIVKGLSHSLSLATTLCHTCLHRRIQHEPRSGTACSQICVTGNPSPHEWTSHPPYAPHMSYPHMGPRDVLLGSNQNAVAPGYAHVHHHLHTANATPDSKMSSRYFNRNNRSVQGKMVQYEPHPYYSIVDSSTDRTHRLSHLSLFDSPNHFYPDASRGITRIEEECPYRNRGGSTNRRYSPCDWIHSAAPEDSVLPLCVHPGHVQRTEATEGTDGRKSIVLCCTCGLPRSSCNHD